MGDWRRPTHDLSLVQDLVGAGDWIWAHAKAQREAIANGYLVSDVEARVRALTVGCFESSSRLRPSELGTSGSSNPLPDRHSEDRWLDVYITDYEGTRIYIKFEIVTSKGRSYVVLWSCHPAVR